MFGAVDFKYCRFGTVYYYLFVSLAKMKLSCNLMYVAPGIRWRITCLPSSENVDRKILELNRNLTPLLKTCLTCVFMELYEVFP